MAFGLLFFLKNSTQKKTQRIPVFYKNQQIIAFHSIENKRKSTDRKIETKSEHIFESKFESRRVWDFTSYGRFLNLIEVGRTGGSCQLVDSRRLHQ